MKKLVTIFAMILSGFYAKSQSSPFINIDTSCVWVHDFSYGDGLLGFPYFCNAELTTYVEKDTVIGNRLFYKLITYPTSDATSNSVSREQECKAMVGTFVTFIYEDTINNVVVNSELADSLLYQYNLQIGDSIKSHFNFPVDSITQEMFNGVVRTCRWGAFNSMFVYRIIDGIGPEVNFPFSAYGEWASPVYNLKCFKKNGVTLYPNNPVDSYIKKPLVPVGINEWKTNLFVNFSFNQLIIQHANHKLIYTLFDLTGRKIISEEVKEQNYTKSFGHLFPSGIYILQINNGTQYLNRKIFIE